MCHLRIESGLNIISGNTMSPQIEPIISYDPEDLCFSGVLKKNRRYGLTGNSRPIRKNGILLACLAGKPQSGTFTMKVYKGREMIGTSTLPSSELSMDGWTWFSFPIMENCNGFITVELCPSGIEGLGVFELHSKRSFIYKVFNKLGHPLKGVDILKAVLLCV
jgi:hypothetical protein